MQVSEVIHATILLLQAIEDGKITGKELKQVFNALIDDNVEFSVQDVAIFLKSLLHKF